LQNPLVGATVVATPLALPHWPLTGPGLSGAEQEALVPPLAPAQVQLQGPLPDTDDGEPTPHSPLVGAVVVATPLALPHWPLTAPGLTGAEQEALVPPLAPAQFQVQGPLPETADGVPALQRPDVGAVVVATPPALPHWPLTGPALTGAVQDASVPPLAPRQLQAQGPVPETAEGVPAVHSFDAGAAETATPLALPHWPLTAPALTGAVQ